MLPAMTRIAPSMLLATTLTLFGARAALADTTVQVPLDGILDARCVTTISGGTLTVFNLTIDGGGGDVGTGNLQNGFVTQAVATSKGNPTSHAVPDDGKFPANARHPDVVLHFSNDASPTAPQTHMVNPTNGTFTFPVPPATYSKMFLFFHGADGGTKVTLTLSFADATTQVLKATIPDFFADPSDANVFNLATDLAKYSKTTGIAEAGGHRIFGVEVDVTDATKTLMSVKVERAGLPGYLVFWGATGIATGAVGTIDGGAGGSTGTDGGTATGGTSGATGGTTGATGGTTGAGGSTATGGTTGATGGTTGAGGMTASGGSTGAGGATATGGTTGTGKSSGGGCNVAASDARLGGLFAVALAMLVVRRRARR